MLRKKVTYYLHNKKPDMACFRRWAELEKDVITAESLRKAQAPLLAAARAAVLP